MQSFLKKTGLMLLGSFYSITSSAGLGISDALLELHINPCVSSGGNYASHRYGKVIDLPVEYRGPLLTRGGDSGLQQVIECPKKKQKKGRASAMPTAHARASDPTPETQPKSAYELCEELLADSEDGLNTIENEGWVLEAFKSLQQALQKEFGRSLRHSIPQSFLVVLANSYYGEVKEISPKVASVSRKYRDIGDDLQDYIDQADGSFIASVSVLRFVTSAVRLGDIRESILIKGAPETTFLYPTYSLQKSGINRGHNFIINSLLHGEGCIQTLLQESLDLFCLSLYPDLANHPDRTTGHGLLKLFIEMGYIKGSGAEKSEGLTVDTSVVSRVPADHGVSYLTPGRLIELLGKYYTEENPVPLLAEQLSAIQQPVAPRPEKVSPRKKKASASATQPASVEQCTGATNTVSPGSPVDLSDKALPGKALKKKKTVVQPPREEEPVIPFSLETLMEKTPRKQFAEALDNADVEKALELFKSNRRVIESYKKKWENDKLRFAILIKFLKPLDADSLLIKYNLRLQ